MLRSGTTSEILREEGGSLGNGSLPAGRSSASTRVAAPQARAPLCGIGTGRESVTETRPTSLCTPFHAFHHGNALQLLPNFLSHDNKHTIRKSIVSLVSDPSGLMAANEKRQLWPPRKEAVAMQLFGLFAEVDLCGMKKGLVPILTAFNHL